MAGTVVEVIFPLGRRETKKVICCQNLLHEQSSTQDGLVCQRPNLCRFSNSRH
jgi:hypothetical protein